MPAFLVTTHAGFEYDTHTGFVVIAPTAKEALQHVQEDLQARDDYGWKREQHRWTSPNVEVRRVNVNAKRPKIILAAFRNG